jgi:hypothetical protein
VGTGEGGGESGDLERMATSTMPIHTKTMTKMAMKQVIDVA